MVFGYRRVEERQSCWALKVNTCNAWVGIVSSLTDVSDRIDIYNSTMGKALGGKL
jgi:hypothetical protein